MVTTNMVKACACIIVVNITDITVYRRYNEALHRHA